MRKYCINCDSLINDKKEEYKEFNTDEKIKIYSCEDCFYALGYGGIKNKAQQEGINII